MANVIGRVEELTRQERKALRAQTRALRKQAQGLRLCGAKTRQGRPCWNGTSKGRCRMHGGASTGPKTAEGRRRALEALKRYRESRQHE
jgi:hypothetical protein